MNNKKVISHIVDWIKDYVDSSDYNINSLVVGVSGGIDSALTSTLCAMTGIKTIVINIPLKTKDSSLSSMHCNFLLSKYSNVQSHEVDLSSTFDKFYDICVASGFENDLGFANSKSRLRMILLYQVASKFKGIVIGTGNKVEDFGVGFFTKYGDGGVDISPIADLYKSEVYHMAEHLDIIKKIMDAPPTDGLWEDGRTDEQQLGYSYDDLEKAMKADISGEIVEDPHLIHVIEKFRTMRGKNKHKMSMPPVCSMEKL